MTKEQVIEKIGITRWPAFTKWMEGQTMSLGEDGKCRYYSDDVQRFLRGKRIID